MEILDNIRYGDDSPSEEAEETTAEGSAAGDPEPESTPEPEQPESESAEATEDEPATEAEVEPESTEAASEEEEAEPQDTTEEPETEESATLIDLDGEQVTLDQIREWRRDGLRQSDYTRKRQEEAARVKAAEDRDALLAEVVADESMQQFIGAHPEVLPKLLRDPENTRALLGKPTEVQALWDDYALIADNPRLAERFNSDDPQATEALEHQRTADNVMAVANALDAEVDRIAAQYEGVDADAVKDYVMKLGRVPMEADADPNAVVDAFGRLYTLFFVEDNDGIGIDGTLIQNHFESLKSSLSADAAEAAAQAEDHNAQVDAQLKDTPAAPATPAGDAPAPVIEELGEAKDVNEVIHGLLGYND
jgi:hypothetical protein